jgi:hypothetical protein
MDLAAAATRSGGRTITTDPGHAPSEIEPLDTVVVLLLAAHDVAPLAAVLESAPEGARVLVFFPCRASQIPVGRLVDALMSQQAQAIAVVPVDDRAHPSALLVERGAEVPAAAWLASRGIVDLDEGQRRRLRAEQVIGGAVDRAGVLAQQSATGTARLRAARAEARAKSAEAAVARLTVELRAVRASRSFEVGEAFAEVKREPLSGVLRLPGRLRRAGKGSSGR